MIQKFRKKPVDIEAIQYTGDNLKEVIEFTGKHPRFNEWFSSFEEYENFVKNDRGIFKIFPSNGEDKPMKVFAGDYVIKGEDRSFYRLPSHVFDSMYELFSHSQEEKEKNIKITEDWDKLLNDGWINEQYAINNPKKLSIPDFILKLIHNNN